jgi:Protein of unknown function (DUF2911)
MMKGYLYWGAVVSLLAASAAAQQATKGTVAEGGGVDDRGSARVLYWDQAADAAAGQFAVNYGRPVWKKIYEDKAKFDAMTIGKVYRLGSNYWSTLDTNLPLKISGKSVPVGLYYIGLQRSADGSQWSLAFIDPAKARRAHLDAFDIRKAKVEFVAPMTAGKAPSTVDKLTITMHYTKEDIRHVTMEVAWGNLELTAPVEVVAP